MSSDSTLYGDAVAHYVQGIAPTLMAARVTLLSDAALPSIGVSRMQFGEYNPKVNKTVSRGQADST